MPEHRSRYTGRLADPYYQSRYVPDPAIEVWSGGEIVRYLQPWLRSANAVLDLGAGYCDFINNVQASSRYAVDLSEDSVLFAADGVRHIVKPVDDLSPVPGGAIDVVFSSNLLEHLNDQQLRDGMREVQRVLKPDGLFITLQPNYRLAYRNYFDDPTHVKVFSDVALEHFLVANQFRIIRAWPRFLPFSMKSRPLKVGISSVVVRGYLNSPWKPFAGQVLFIAQKRGPPTEKPA